ncbi:MAG: hypothetical protein Q7R60_00850 [bacterium]|nr:hypothetical protein [bacterium]
MFEFDVPHRRNRLRTAVMAGSAALATAVTLLAISPSRSEARATQSTYPVRIIANQYGQTSARPGEILILGLDGESMRPEARLIEARISSNVLPIPFTRVDGWIQTPDSDLAGPNLDRSWFMWTFYAPPINNVITSDQSNIPGGELFLQFRMPTRAALGKLGLKELCAVIKYDAPGIGLKPRVITKCWALTPDKTKLAP